MSKISKILSSLLLLFLTILSSILYYYYLNQTKYTGKIFLKNSYLNSPIQIHTDENGFVHIKTENRKDAFFALGLAHARDRLFSMDVQRRISRGKLSEIFGEKLLYMDKISKNIGFERNAKNDVEKLSKLKEHQETNEMMQNYCNGINYWANTNSLPIEYYLLNVKFENWTLIDSFAFMRFMDFSMSGDFHIELLHHLLNDILGKNFYKLHYETVLYDYPYFNETYLTRDFISKNNLSTEKNFAVNLNKKIQLSEIPEIDNKVSFIKQSDIRKGFDDLKEDYASNSWMVHGNFTKNGKPVFSNDPHLNNAIPGIHYVVKLYIGKNDEEILVGSAPPGVPAIIIGNNKHLAFGFTTDYRDRGDFIEELLDNENITEAKYYFVDGKKYELKTIIEEIKIKGKKTPLKYEIKYTQNGPLIEKLPKEYNGIGFEYEYKSTNKKKSNALSFNFFGFKNIFNINFFYKRMFAQKKEEFIHEIKNYIGPPFSFSWATKNNEIGYIPIGLYPITPNPKILFKKGYNSSEYNNKNIKFIPFKDVPILINPAEGYFSTANSHPIPDNYKYFSTTFEIPWRHHRIQQLLKEKTKNKKYSVSDSLSILSDTKDTFCELFLPDLLTILKKYIKKDLYSYKYFELLNNFDCDMKKNSKAATVYQVFIYKLIQHLLLKNEKNGVNNGFNNEDEVNDLMYKHTIDLVVYKIIHSSVENGKYLNFENCQFFQKNHNCQEYVIDVFHRLFIYLKNYGFLEKNENVKLWGEINRHYYPNVLHKVKILDWIFSRKIFTDGNKNTVKVATWRYSIDLKNPFNSIHSANLKYINDLSDITRPYICIDTGNSGNILSKFYDNLMEKCEKNQLIKIEDYKFTNDEKKELILEPIRN